MRERQIGSLSTNAAASIPLPGELAGTTVKVRDSAGVERSAPLFFVSPNQINYQLPPGTASGRRRGIPTAGIDSSIIEMHRQFLRDLSSAP
jgi:uncharacterized protein (TIGR03437 family)